MARAKCNLMVMISASILKLEAALNLMPAHLPHEGYEKTEGWDYEKGGKVERWKRGKMER